MKDLKEKTIRSGSARMAAQISNFALRLGSMVILARLLNPVDFGLVGMVTAFTGVLVLFRDFGLSAASVQRAEVTEAQKSTLFWINLATGAFLMLLAICAAPVVSRFYHEPRLVWVMATVSVGFLVNGAGVQHSALLQREMRFTALAFIEVLSLVVSNGLAVTMAKLGYGYWALVGMTIAAPLTTTVGAWVATAWIPGPPRRGIGIRSMMQFGGTVTLNSLVLYLTYNLVNVLLGRFWGATAIGIYGRASQLVRIPTDNLNSAVGEVAFAALSRIQNDLERLKRYFLKGYSIVLALTLPIMTFCALCSDDLIFVVLGPKWKEAADIFRLLTPTIVVFAIANPLGWLLSSLGLVGRALRIAFAFAPLMVIACIVGLPYGPRGLAIAYSTVMTLWLVPSVMWALYGTGITVWDILKTLVRPLGSAILGGGVAFAMQLILGGRFTPLIRLIAEGTVLLITYLVVLLFVADQKAFYIDLLRRSKQAEAAVEKDLVAIPEGSSN